MNDFVMIAITAVVAFVLGVLACILIHRQKAKNDQRKIADAEAEALRIVNEAIKNAESKKREALVEAKEEILRSRNEYEKEVRERRADLQKQATFLTSSGTSPDSIDVIRFFPEKKPFAS